MQPNPINVATNEIERRKAAACRAFWSDQPLNMAYRRHVGRGTFTLKAFVAWVAALPAADFDRLIVGRS